MEATDMTNNFGKDIAISQQGDKVYITPVSGKGHFFMQNETAKEGHAADRYIGTDTYVFNSYDRADYFVQLATAKRLEVIAR
jgi:hypothetical protein